MKSLLTILLVSLCHTSFGQITEGKITYSMTMENNNFDDEESELVYPESTIELYFTKDKTRTSVQTGSNMIVTSVLDHSTQKGLIIMSGLMGNLAIMANYSDFTQASAKENVEIQFLEQTKEIAGYLCKKAKVTDASGNLFTIWYTEEIVCNKSGVENMFGKLPGTPLEYRIDSDGTTSIFRLIEIKTEIDNLDILFSTSPPEGHKVLTMAEFEAGEF